MGTLPIPIPVPRICPGPEPAQEPGFDAGDKLPYPFNPQWLFQPSRFFFLKTNSANGSSNN